MIKHLPQEKLHHKILSGTIYGDGGGTKLLEDREACVFVKTRRRTPKKWNKRLQGHRADDVVRIVYYSSSGERGKLESWKRLHVGGIDGISCQHLQVIDKAVAGALVVARGLEANDETRQRDTTHNVPGQHGHQDGFRCGTTKAHRENYGRS